MRPMARLSTSRCQPIRAARRDDPAWLLLRPRSGVHASSDVSIWSGPWGWTRANLRSDGYAGLSKNESPWPSTAFTASSSSVSRHVATTDSDHDQPIRRRHSQRLVAPGGLLCDQPVDSYAADDRRPRGRDRATTPVSWMRASFGSGSQYASERYRDTLTAHALVGSMGRRGNPYDNAKAESFMNTLEGRGCVSNGVETLEDVIENLPRFIDGVYNKRRLRSALGYLSPQQFRGSARPAEGQISRLTLSGPTGPLH